MIVVKNGQSTVTVVADTAMPPCPRITTMEIRMPNYFSKELLRHRSFSFCEQSTRATPVRVIAEGVKTAPAFFDHLGINKSGMVADEALTGKSAADFKAEWDELARICAIAAERWSSVFGLHKQVANQIMIPFLYTRILVTGTADAWKHFLNLRLAPDSRPEMQNLATAVRDALDESKPLRQLFHCPYFNDLSDGMPLRDRQDRSVAACARVCITRHDGHKPKLAQDFALVTDLLANQHLSPFEHVAVACTDQYDERFANLMGWRSLRMDAEEKLRLRGCLL